jgi:translation initiation factor IF-3
MSKREKETKKKQRAAQVETKELRFRPNTGAHDIEIMLKHAEKFLDRGDRVKFCLRTKGRESARLKELLGSMETTVSELNVNFIVKPQISGRQVTCVVEKNND